ncbi:MAG: efflux RND transporter periplasmic adaptor subunit [Pseudoxanthomonas suwonensis]|nr:efflux RND transporter periplasmic adaptor subunit [Pseudoxanthomonas suwonensis]
MAVLRRTTLIQRMLLVIALALLAACKPAGMGKQADDSETTAEALPVEVVAVSRRAIAASYSGTAPLEARAEAQVVAKTSGVALRVMAEEGQAVRAGQTLVQLDSDQQRLRVAQATAQVSKLEANYRRAAQLAEQRMVSAADVDQLRFDLANARAARDLARLELSYSTVVAPISGVIASRSIKPGNLVQINTPIFRIVDVSRLEATLNVPERELETLKVGQPVQLTVDAIPGRIFEGTVARIAPVVDAGSGTFRVVTAFDGGGLLQPGMFGRLRVDHDRRADALAMPRAALLDDEAEPTVFLVRGGKAQRQTVQLGHVDGDWVQVSDGLAEGDQVVTAGKVALREGSSVQIIGAANAAGAAVERAEAAADADQSDAQ